MLKPGDRVHFKDAHIDCWGTVVPYDKDTLMSLTNHWRMPANYVLALWDDTHRVQLAPLSNIIESTYGQSKSIIDR